MSKHHTEPAILHSLKERGIVGQLLLVRAFAVFACVCALLLPWGSALLLLVARDTPSFCARNSACAVVWRLVNELWFLCMSPSVP